MAALFAVGCRIHADPTWTVSASKTFVLDILPVFERPVAQRCRSTKKRFWFQEVHRRGCEPRVMFHYNTCHMLLYMSNINSLSGITI